ncbi:MAG: hypothetical protein Phyf2KO_14960 [Phycisphaerales bacterium]
MKRVLIAAIASAGSANADLEVFTPTGELLLPLTSDFACVNPGAPGVSYEFFDIRLNPDAQPVLDNQGTFVIVGDCGAGGSFARTININNCPSPNSGNIRFAHGGPSIPAGTLYDLSGNANFNPITGPYPFAPGQAVGPNTDWSFESHQTLGLSPTWTRPPQFDITDDDFRSDIDWVASGIIIGIEITEADGVHYGWIEFQRLPGFDENKLNQCSEQYRVVRYAYETTPGVPAFVTPSCLADVNGDGMATPADFTAWINAFNNNLPTCDQNEDGACTPTDFTAWVDNFNNGC